jgi:hypothetical protein
VALTMLSVTPLMTSQAEEDAFIYALERSLNFDDEIDSDPELDELPDGTVGGGAAYVYVTLLHFTRLHVIMCTSLLHFTRLHVISPTWAQRSLLRWYVR